MQDILVEAVQFLLSQYEGGSGSVAEQAALLRKKLKGDPPATAEAPVTVTAETESEPVAHHVADEPLRTQPQRKRKGHA